LPFVKSVIGSVLFVNVYLMPKSQFAEFITKVVELQKTILLPSKVAYGKSI
jgi:hypothetical protein